MQFTVFINYVSLYAVQLIWFVNKWTDA